MKDIEIRHRVETSCLGHGILPEAWRHCAKLHGIGSHAAAGCLLALAELAWGAPLCAYVCRGGGWCVESAHDQGKTVATDTRAPNRTEALVAALEAAPR